MTTYDLEWEGRPVPWVTRWTGEIINAPYQGQITREGLRAFYPDGKENREASGILWQREGLTRGGRPDWASVSTYRQRTSMTRRRCQVCGEKIDSKVIRWLMPPNGILQHTLEAPEDGLTMQPPTCEKCIEISLDLCPNLKRNGHMIVKVLDYEVWGVMGEILLMTEDGRARMQNIVSYDLAQSREMYGDSFSFQAVLAKQQVVKLTKYSVES